MATFAPKEQCIVVMPGKPDDCLAVKLLKLQQLWDIRGTIVCGGNDCDNKANKIMVSMGLTCPVYVGSEDEFDTFQEEKPSEYEFDMNQVEPVKCADGTLYYDYAAHRKATDAAAAKEMVKFSQLTDKEMDHLFGGGSLRLTIFCFCPMFDLLEHVPDKYKRNKTLCFTGSFNLRCLYKKGITQERLEEEWRKYLRVYCAETFYALKEGEDNTVVFEEEDLAGVNVLIEGSVQHRMKRWDQFNRDDCYATCVNILPGGGEPHDLTLEECQQMTPRDIQKYQRNYQAYTQIRENMGKQMVMSALLLVLFGPDDYDRVTLSSDDNGYTITGKPGVHTNTYMIKKVGRKTVVDRLLDHVEAAKAMATVTANEA